jgi:hypothetical protein
MFGGDSWSLFWRTSLVGVIYGPLSLAITLGATLVALKTL